MGFPFMTRRITRLDPYYGQVSPCPFCGETEVDMEESDNYHVACQACCSLGPLGCTEEEAVSLWNVRMPLGSSTR